MRLIPTNRATALSRQDGEVFIVTSRWERIEQLPCHERIFEERSQLFAPRRARR